VQGLTGFAFGLAAIGFWAWGLEPHLTGALVVLGSILSHMFTIGSVRRSINARLVAPFIAGGALGIPFGVLLLHRIDPIAFKIGVGALLTVYCPIALLGRGRMLVRAGWPADAAVGWIGGVMGGISGLAGPPATLWSGMRGWDHNTQRGVYQTYNLAMQVFAFVGFLASGIIVPQTLQMFAIALPAIIVCALAGAQLYKRFSPETFRTAVLLLLTVSGIVLLIATLSSRA
jgi:uncharacterized protein